MRAILVRSAIAGAALGAFAVFGVSAGLGEPSRSDASRSVTVTMTDAAFRLVPASVPATGSVAFRLVNRGKLSHDFHIAGKKSPTVAPGKTVTFTVSFGKAGGYPYFSALHAKTAMKGLFAVGISSTVSVSAADFKFTLSSSTGKLGADRFTIKNDGQTAHNFSINGKTSPLVAPGSTTTLTVVFTRAGSYRYLCTIPGHAQQGMEGTFTVS
jgi:uncharacterized cupredoxin-like copper-binding protein